MTNIYADIILDHYKNPRNFGTLESHNAEARDNNPLCGDVIGVQIKIEKNIIRSIKFTGQGCAISQASASMLTEELIGKNTAFVKNLKNKDIVDMLGIDLSATRMKCALLIMKVVKLAVYRYLGEKMEEEQ
jgi:nitrogen fixation NifU-like protein